MSREVRYFGPRREPAALVTDFGELRTGMVVWTTPCPWCGGAHRRLLLDGPHVEPTRTIEGGVIVTALYETLPRRKCVPRVNISGDCVTATSVEKRNVYAVIDEQLASDSTGERTARELERVR